MAKEKYDFKIEYDEDEGIRLELSPEGINRVVGGLARLAAPLIENAGLETTTLEDIQQLFGPDMKPPIKRAIPISEGKHEEGMEIVPSEPTVKGEPKHPEPYEGEDCDHPALFKARDENEWLDKVRDAGYRGVSRPWQNSGFYCYKCLRRVV